MQSGKTMALAQNTESYPLFLTQFVYYAIGFFWEVNKS